MNGFKLSFLYKVLLFVVVPLFLFLFIPSFFSKPIFAACSPVGAQRCSGSGFQQCDGTNWVSYSCPAGYFCTVVGTNDVSCVSGCTQRGYSCQPSCQPGQTSQPYYCSSGTCCSGVADQKYACVDGTCQVSATGTYTDPTCGGACPPPPGGGGAPPPPPPNTADYSICYKEGKACTDSNFDPNGKGCCPGLRCAREAGPDTGTVCKKVNIVPATSCLGSNCPTAVGDISTNPYGFVKIIFGILLSISGAIAVLLIIISGYRLMASQGNPERIQGAREQLTAAIIGLIFVILSFSILRFIGIDVLGIFP